MGFDAVTVNKDGGMTGTATSRDVNWSVFPGASAFGSGPTACGTIIARFRFFGGKEMFLRRIVAHSIRSLLLLASLICAVPSWAAVPTLVQHVGGAMDQNP